MPPLRRTPVLTDIESELDKLEDGMTVAFGGFNTASHPMTVVRGVIRRGLRDLTVVGSAISGLDLDLLIGAGVASKVVTSSVTGEVLAAVGPFYRQAAEQGSVEIWECDEGIFYAGLRAGGQGLPFAPWKAGLGSSIPELNPELKVFSDPISGEQLLAVPSIKPDVAFIHVERADVYGLGQHTGSGFGDRMLHRAAGRTVLTAEEIVPNEEIRRNPLATSIPYASAVIRAPWGAHPFSSPGTYRVDEAFVDEYVAVANKARKGDREDFEQWLAHWVLEPSDQVEYLERLGVRRLYEIGDLSGGEL
jgi:glutaconate CoA-transferase subunit A